MSPRRPADYARRVPDASLGGKIICLPGRVSGAYRTGDAPLSERAEAWVDGAAPGRGHAVRRA